jgi:hypothetical protein
MKGKIQYYNTLIEYEFNESGERDKGMGYYSIKGVVLPEPNEFMDYFQNGEYESLDPEAFIMILNTICKAFPSPTIKVEVWNSSLFWFFHDIIHSWQHEDESKLFVDESLELEAFGKGLLLSLQNGIPLWECMREIHSVNGMWRGEDYGWNDVLKKVYSIIPSFHGSLLSISKNNESLYLGEK